MGVAQAEALLELPGDEAAIRIPGNGYLGQSHHVTKGDDIAEVLYLMGVRPVWGERSGREHIELIPIEEPQRPRIDVALRISGFFRDAFQICASC